MTINPIKNLKTISQRIIYGLNFMYSEFVPIESEKVNEQSQLKLHKLMGRMIDKLHDAPEFLNLADKQR